MASRLRSHNRKRAIRILGTVTALLLVAAAGSLLMVRAFTIRNVVIDGHGMSVEIDREKLGTNLLAVPTDELRAQLLSAYPLLSDVSFEKRLPGTLIVRLIRRQPFAEVRTRTGQYLIGAGGVVLDNAPPHHTYPVLAFDTEPLTIGSLVSDERVRSSLSFLREIPSSWQINRMSDYQGSAIRAVYEDTDILLPHAVDLRQKARTLQVIVEGFRIKGTLPSVIDLRFEKPVITN